MNYEEASKHQVFKRKARRRLIFNEDENNICIFIPSCILDARSQVCALDLQSHRNMGRKENELTIDAHARVRYKHLLLSLYMCLARQNSSSERVVTTGRH